MKYISKIAFAALSSALAFGLSACGDEVTEQVINKIDNVGSVETKDKLPECNDDLSGQTAYVKDQGTFFGCDGESWKQLGGNTVSVGDNVCSSTELKDGAGFEIFCNGVSLGKIFNGKDGEDGLPGSSGSKGDKGDQGDEGKPGAGCKMIDKQADSLKVVIQCGTETFAMNLGGLDASQECEEGDLDCAEPMDNVQLSGQSQKGPFVTGADVTAYELLNGQTLKQTGNMFAGKIEREDGLFNIKTVKLASQYAYLVADGFYRNEVTGKISNTTLRLRALANLSRKNTANINLITHLEYDRAVNLVTGNEKMKVLDAKKKAEKEILAAFHINTTILKSSEYAEDLNILTPGDGNAALLAISAMLQGDRTEAELTTLLASLSVDLGEDGDWSNAREKAEIADWAMEQTLIVVNDSTGLERIRANVEGWKLAESKAPAFEKFIRNFWEKEYGLPECSADVYETIKRVSNRNSGYYALNDTTFSSVDKSSLRFLCDKSSKQWKIATNEQIENYRLVDADPSKAFRGVDTNKVFVFENGIWRQGSTLDLDENLGPCVADFAGKVGQTSNEVWYTCSSEEKNEFGNKLPATWRLSTEYEIDTYGWTIPTDEDSLFRRGNVNKDNMYVLSKSVDADHWLKASIQDSILGLKTETNVFKYKSIPELKSVERITNCYDDEEACDCAKTSKYDYYVFERKSKFDALEYPYQWRLMPLEEADTAGFGSALTSYYKQGRVTCLWYHSQIDVKSHDYAWKVVEEAQTAQIDPSEDAVQIASWSNGYLQNIRSEAYSNIHDGDIHEIRYNPNIPTFEKTYMKYDRVAFEWQPIIRSQAELGIGGCTVTKSQYTPSSNTSTRFYPKGEVAQDTITGKKNWYLCKENAGTFEWVLASDVRVKTYRNYCSATNGVVNRAVRKLTLNDGTTDYFVCDADTFRVMTKSEKWALENGQGSALRCGLSDYGATIKLRETGATYECKNGLYVWDGNSKVYPQALRSSTSYNYYDIVVLGTQVWTTSNLYDEDYTLRSPLNAFECSSSSATTSPSCKFQNNVSLIGSFYTISTANTECGKLKPVSGKNVSATDAPTEYHLPSYTEWKTMQDVVPNAAYTLRSTDGWPSRSGNNQHGFDLYPSGTISTSASSSCFYCIGYGTETSTGYSVTRRYAWDYPTSTAKFLTSSGSFVTHNGSAFGTATSSTTAYASARCVAGNTPLPPTSN